MLFDANRDLALLRVPGLAEPPLRVAKAKEGDTGAVYGHPGGGDLRAAPAKISQELIAVGRDIYDRNDTRRSIFVLASALRPGDSGAALVDKSGQVVGVAFAIAPDKPGVSYALTDKELSAGAGQGPGRPPSRPAAASTRSGSAGLAVLVVGDAVAVGVGRALLLVGTPSPSLSRSR